MTLEFKFVGDLGVRTFNTYDSTTENMSQNIINYYEILLLKPQCPQSIILNCDYNIVCGMI